MELLNTTCFITRWNLTQLNNVGLLISVLKHFIEMSQLILFIILFPELNFWKTSMFIVVSSLLDSFFGVNKSRFVFNLRNKYRGTLMITVIVFIYLYKQEIEIRTGCLAKKWTQKDTWKLAHTVSWTAKTNFQLSALQIYSSIKIRTMKLPGRVGTKNPHSFAQILLYCTELWVYRVYILSLKKIK